MDEHRRRFLATVGVYSLAGCLDWSDSNPTPRPKAETPPTKTRTNSPTQSTDTEYQATEDSNLLDINTELVIPDGDFKSFQLTIPVGSPSTLSYNISSSSDIDVCLFFQKGFTKYRKFVDNTESTKSEAARRPHPLVEPSSFNTGNAQLQNYQIPAGIYYLVIDNTRYSLREGLGQIRSVGDVTVKAEAKVKRE